MPDTEPVDPAQATARLASSVREAGALALSMFRTPLRTWTKGESSPVCEADIAVDRLLHERLTGEGSGIAWLSEESADDPARLGARYVWIVDPIDGTRAYLAGLPDWAVSAALVDHGRPIAACLYAPVTEEFFSASAGGGAMCNGRAIAATTGTSLEGARIAGPRRWLERLAGVAPPFIAMPRVRSLALRLARVAQGAFDVAIAGVDSHDWDLAAADLLVHEAGGALTPADGGAVTYNRPVPRHGMLVAAGRDRHATIIELLRDERLAF
ncbi:MAG: 3'(2'),5'-bisphosphate nucleotidase CysQ [Xanthobacteraceae bacterium]|nr:3'(2'),5'-bisphosphate nucleotidase CysQ [Xanthobacteraceae bacterium]